MRRKTTFTQFQDSYENALLPAMQWKKKGACCSERGPAEDFPRLERSAGVSGRRGWQWEKYGNVGWCCHGVDSSKVESWSKEMCGCP